MRTVDVKKNPVQPYIPGGATLPLPNRDFDPIKPRGPIIRTGDALGSSNPYYYNPYGGGTGTGGSLGPNETPVSTFRGRGKFNIYGGKDDLLKTIAARSYGVGGLTGLLDQEMNAQAAGQGLSEIYQNYANRSGDPLLGEAYSNMAPDVVRDRMISSEKNRAGLSDLLNQYYKMGGQIWGSDIANTGAATQLQNRAEHTKVNNALGWTAGIPFVGGMIHGGLQGFNT